MSCPQDGHRRLDQPSWSARRRDHCALAPGAVGSLWWGGGGVPCRGRARAVTGGGELRGGVCGKGTKVTELTICPRTQRPDADSIDPKAGKAGADAGCKCRPRFANLTRSSPKEQSP